MGSEKDVQLLGLLGKHGSYSFFKSIKMCGKTYAISSHFPVRIWPDSALLSIAEIQLLWADRSESFCSLKLYFLPENTPDGRRQHHGEDEVIALQDRVIIRATDLLSWLVDEADWDWGYLTPPTACSNSPNTALSKAFLSEKFLKNDKDQMDFTDPGSSKIVVLNYERYIRLRTVFKRLEGSPELSNWLSHPLVLALGGLSVGPNCRLLFAKEVFDYPELEDHELLCNHLAPKLKGKPKKRRRRRNPSLGSESNASETSSTGSCGSDKTKKIPNGVVRRDRLHEGLKRAAENNRDELGSGPAVSGFDMNDEMVIKGEISGGRKLANNKLISDVANGKLRSGSDFHTLRSSNHRLDGSSSVGASLMNSAASQSSRSLDVKGEPESPMHVELLGPGLSELAQKLEKSNALQILPIRPSVIQKPDSIVDEECHHALKKRLKAEASAIMDATDAFRLPSAEFEALSRGWSAQFGRGFHSVYGPPLPLPKQQVSKVNKTGNKVEQQHSSAALLGKTNHHIPKIERPVLSITPVDADVKKQPIPSIRLTSPSPFVPTTRIYGDPNVFRKGQSSSSSSAASLSRRGSEHSGAAKMDETKSSIDALDFSVKRRRTESDVTKFPSSSGSSSNGGDLGLLDLSTKSQHLSPNQGSNKNIFHSLADIPPPNAMNQLGLRLTSEVTLFPSNPPTGCSVPETKNVREGMPSKTPHASTHVQIKPSGSSGSGTGSSSKSSPPWLPKQPAIHTGNIYRSSSSSSASGNSGSSLSSSGKNHVNEKSFHGASQDSHSSCFNPVKNQLPPPRLPTPQKSPKGHRSDQQFQVQTGVKDRHAVPGHSSSSNSKPVSHFSVERVETRDVREKSREGSNQSRNSNSLGLPGIPPAFMPKIDPAYMQLFAPPHMFMPPPGMSLPGMLGMAPGAMEQLQFYKELLQHGLAPQFPGWPTVETMKERGPK